MSSNTSVPPIDLAELNDTFGKKNARTLLAVFEDEASRLIAELELVVKSGDVHEVRRKAHALKGICGNLRAQPLMHACRELELAAYHNTSEIHHLFQKLNESFAETGLFVSRQRMSTER